MKKNNLTLTAKAAFAICAASAFCLGTTIQAAETANTGTKSNLSMNDKKFVKKAYKGGLTEVATAQMAKDKAKDEATKNVADHMITDHTKANDQLMQIAKEENLDLSKIEGKAATISGENFDKEFLTMLKSNHEKTIAMFEKEASDTGAKEDSDVVKFAKDTLPTLKEHLQMIEDALSKMK
jgi:putative membrane protein